MCSRNKLNTLGAAWLLSLLGLKSCRQSAPAPRQTGLPISLGQKSNHYRPHSMKVPAKLNLVLTSIE